MSMEKFHWTSPSGVEIVLPHMNKIKAGILRRHRKSDPVDFIFSVLEDVSDEEMIGRVDELDMGDIDDLFSEWQRAGVPVGESSRSSN